MSSIMKGIVDEGEEVAVIYIDGKPSVKYAKKHEAEADAARMRERHPNKKIEIKHEVRETEAKKGADGKRCWKGKRYAGTENGKDKCIPVKNEAANPAQQAAIAIAKKKKAKTNEGVIVGHDANDPEVAVLGGAGTMSLSRLKKKAHGEALQLADDIANGKYSASSYNMKQLHNTLNTIVAAEEEMKKKYFGESEESPYQAGYKAWKDYLAGKTKQRPVNPYPAGQGMGAWERGAGDAAEHLDWDTGNLEEDYTGEFAAEVTPTVNPHAGVKDNKFRGAIGEGIDEAREMSPALRAAQQNLIDLSTGEVRRREDAKRAAAKREREYTKQAARDARPKKPTLDKIWQHVEHAISNYFPDGDPTDYLNPYMRRVGIDWDDITRAAKKNGYKDLWDYWNTLAQDIENDAYADWHISGGKNVRQRAPFMETPTDNPTGASGEGGWRKYKPKSAGEVDEGQIYSTGGGCGQSYRKFKPKSAGTFKESAIMKGLKSEGF